MNLMPGVRIVDLALFLDDPQALVLGDTHLGYEKELSAQGIFIPKMHFDDLMRRILPIIERTHPKEIILNGDIKHEFGTISDEEWRQARKLIETLSSHAQVTLIKGNHDAILGPIARETNLRIVDHVLLGDTFICHGDVLFDTHPDFVRASTVVIGHEHPALTLRDGVRSEKYKCFLKGNYLQKNLIVMPSMSQLFEGTDVTSEKLLSPFLRSGADSFEAFLISPVQLPDSDQGVFAFGRVGKLS
jgi:uncharacterized protein